MSYVFKTQKKGLDGGPWRVGCHGRIWQVGMSLESDSRGMGNGPGYVVARRSVVTVIGKAKGVPTAPMDCNNLILLDFSYLG